jgi:DNA-binding beta-propeller fold protein YncE
MNPTRTHKHHVASYIWLLTLVAVLLVLGRSFNAVAAPGQSSGFHIVDTWKLSGTGLWDYVIADPDERRLYVTRLNRVEVLNLDTGALLGTVGGLGQVHGVALAPDFGRGFITDGLDSSVVVFDTKTFQVTTRIALPENATPDGIAYDPYSKRIFTCNNKAKTSTVIDARDAKVTGTIDFQNLRPEGIVPDGNGRIYFTLPRGQEVVVVDTSSLKILAHWPLDAEKFKLPHSVAIDVLNQRLFVGCENNRMAVVDIHSGKPIADLPLGDGHDAAAYDPVERLVFTSNEEGTLTIITEATPNEFKLLENVKTGKWGRTMALDTKTHRAYVVAGDLTPLKPLPGEKHPIPAAVVEGTFRVIVLGR